MQSSKRLCPTQKNHMQCQNYLLLHSLIPTTTTAFIQRVYEGAAHNIPDATAELAAREALSLAERASAEELVITLLSGGGSALLPCPVEGVSLQEKRQVCRI